jgi:prepilin-type N-terminal cleavage/methylation domain-containing protein
MKRGFSLFEILLALLIMSMIVVGGIEYASRKNETSAAEQLGHRLYLYGLAVSDYARQNPQKLTVETEFYGINWLKNEPNPESCTHPDDLTTCKTFLGQDFNLQFQSIHLESFSDVEDPEDAQMFTRLTPHPAPSSGLKIDLVQLGRVLKYTKATNDYHADLSLATRAINAANHFNDPFLGSPQLTYKLSSYDAEGHIYSDGLSTGTGIDSAFLRLDGTNSMKASIRFAETAASNNVEGVKTIQFVDSANNPRKSSENISGMRMGRFSIIDGEDGDTASMFRYTQTSACFLQTVLVWDNVTDQSGHDGCSIDTNGNTQWRLIMSKSGNKPKNGHNCEAICLEWGP